VSGLRVAFLSEHASPVASLGGADAGGQNVYVDEVSRHLGALGLNVDVFVRRDSTETPEVINWAPGVRVIQLDAGAPEYLPKDDIWPFMPDFRDALLRFMQRDGVTYDLLHGNFWMSGWAAAELGDRLRIPVVQIFHALGKTKQRHQGVMDTSPAERIAVERDVVRRTDRLFAQSPSERDELVRDYRADPNGVAIVPSGVNTDRFRPVCRADARARLGLDPDTFVIAYVGRMLPRKDIRNLIRAVTILSGQVPYPPRLLLVGGESDAPDPVLTPEIGELQRLAGELGILDQVTFTGRRSPDELRNYYSAADIAVTTPWYEPFGLTPLEAMACGVPVIGSAVGGITFTVADGVTGLLVPPRDPAALAGKLRYVMEHPRKRVEMGIAARRRVEREFTWPAVAEKTAGIYRNLLKGRTSYLPVGTLAVESRTHSE
jgi:D-inositol-3-phosphate glycosyltransferase